MHDGGAFKRINGGEIEIITSGYFAINAQLHNKHGNSGKWIRTSIKVNNQFKARR